MLKTVVLVVALAMIVMTAYTVNANAATQDEQAAKARTQGNEKLQKGNFDAADAHFDKNARLTESPCPPEGC